MTCRNTREIIESCLNNHLACLEVVMEENVTLAIIGGSGLYNMPGLEIPREHHISTPFGSPSAPIVVGSLEGQRVAFLARHGLGHHLMPGEVPYRANIYALKLLGAERIVSISACGSLREEYAPRSDRDPRSGL
jgi:5'-methylthioadenosine phosphorylase